MQQNYIERLNNIAKHYGLHRQEEQLIEEMAELTKAIIDKRRYENGTLYKTKSQSALERDIVEELADVKIVLEQLTYLMGAQDMVENWMEYKVDRELRRISEKSK
jgi:hypothetical protein